MNAFDATRVVNPQPSQPTPIVPNPRKRKYKPRASLACDTCRAKKAKCDQGFPCQMCRDRDVPCVYGEKRAKPGPKKGLEDQHISTNTTTNLEYQLRSLNPPQPRPHHRVEYFDGHQDSSIDHVGPSTDSESDIVAATNRQTSGTEFYGQSSNAVLVKQLLHSSQLRQSTRASVSRPPTQEILSPVSTSQYSTRPTEATTSPTDPQHGETSQIPLSVVDLFCDASSELPNPRPGSPVTAAGRAQKSPLEEAGHAKSQGMHRNTGFSGTIPPEATAVNSSECFLGNPMLLEMEYVNLFFQNLHLIYPFLSVERFKSRCKKEIWARAALKRLSRSQMHFLALYNAVLAVGSLIAPLDALQTQRAELEIRTEEDRKNGPKYVPSSIRLSRLYFQRSRLLLDDIFEVSSLEGAQTLLLLSVYCQHALKLHPGYMYSGMAVRTAIAIGLPTTGTTMTRNTWYCICVQEMKVSCASGRAVTLPVFPASDHNASGPETHQRESSFDPSRTSTISVQLALYEILREASRDLYLSPQYPFQRKSQIAVDLEDRLEQWKANLPSPLNPWIFSLKESESASRQKLALQIRFYHTKMFIHRPFLSMSASASLSNQHISTCLNAAHDLIVLTCSAFTHRIYFRTWWYNATHVFYASIIILYVLLMPNYRDLIPAAHLRVDELFSDVEKALQILGAMDAMLVSLRYAKLVDEIFRIAKTYDGTSKENEPIQNIQPTSNAGESLQGDLANPSAHSTSLGSEGTLNSTTGHIDFSDVANLPHNYDEGLQRDDLLLTLMDPNLFDEFIRESNSGMSFSVQGELFGSDFYSGLNFAGGQGNRLESWNEGPQS